MSVDAIKLWKVVRVLMWVGLLIFVVSVETASSVPIAFVSLLLLARTRLSSTELWIVITVISLVVATLLLIHPLLVLVILGGVHVLMSIRPDFWRAHPARLLAVSVVLGSAPVWLMEIVVTERVLGLALLSILVAAALLWKFERRRNAESFD